MAPKPEQESVEEEILEHALETKRSNKNVLALFVLNLLVSGLSGASGLIVMKMWVLKRELEYVE